MSVIKIIATAVANFSAPAGTVPGKMRYVLKSSTGIALGLQEFDVTAEPFVAPEIDWPGVDVGHYTMTSQRLDADGHPIGPEFDQAVAIDPPPPVVMSIPIGMTISVV